MPNNVGREYVLRSFLSSVVGDLRPILLIVLGATALLLILACVNVTNLPRLDTVPFDWRVLSFSLAVLVACGLAMGIVPAGRLAVTDIKTVLNDGGRRATSALATSRIMSSLIVAEVALAIALVAGADWLIQSFTRLRGTDPGFVATGRLLIDVRATRAFRSPAEVVTWSKAMVERVRMAAGPARVGAAATFPFGVDRHGTTNIELPNKAPDPARVRSGRMRVVT